MKSDLQFFYVCDFSPQVKVSANIEAIELEHKEEKDSKFQRLLLSSDGVCEEVQMLLKAADHQDEVNKSSKL